MNSKKYIRFKHTSLFPVISLRILIVVIGLFISSNVYAQKSMWVGETYTCDASSAAMGLTSDVSWSTSGGYLSLSGSGFYRNVTVTQYFGGTATIRCSWKYRLYSGDTWKTQTRSWTIRCNENPISIYPSSLELTVGEDSDVSYSYKYSNEYTYSGNAYFTSTNNNVATVSNSGVVTARSAGTAYINVYSKISDPSKSPYCIVTVKEANPTGVSLPTNASVVIGNTIKLTPTVTPSGASTSFLWSSDNSDIATVDSYGNVMGISVGKTKIKVTTTVGGYTAYSTVTVKEPPVPPTKVNLKKSITLYPGFSCVLEPVLEPNNAESKYSWTSADPSIATVNYIGKVLAKKEGTTIITVTTENGLEADCEIVVTKLPTNLDENVLNNRLSTINNLINKTFNKAY